MLLDLHSHTRFSPDSRAEPRALVGIARRIGLNGIAITDHNAVGGIHEAEDAADGILVIPAVEVSSLDGHILALGVREVVPRDLPARDTVERIVALGGVPVAAHPYRFWSGLGEDVVRATAFRVHETRNGRTLRRGNAQASALARELGAGEIGGSDAHFLDEVARAVTSVNGGPMGLDGVLQAIAQRRTRAQGVDRGLGATARYVTKCVSEWLGRGMRRI